MGMGDVKLALLMGVALGATVRGRPSARDDPRARAGRRSSSRGTARVRGRWRSRSRRSSRSGSVIALFAGDALVHAYTSLLRPGTVTWSTSRPTAAH
jgi:hypothetical protein